MVIESSPYVIMRFPVMGKELPADHGYALYGAISRIAPTLHSVDWFASELISGVPWSPGMIALPNRGGHFSVRLPADQSAQVLPLAGKKLEIGSHTIRLGIPTINLLAPSSSLYARMVTIRNFTEPKEFLAAVERQMQELGVTGVVELPIDQQNRVRRRIMRIHEKRIVGFSVAVHKLSDEDSLKLQTQGLGGRRHMGCGIFNPIVRNLLSKEMIKE